VHNLSGLYFLSFSLFLKRGRGKRNIEKPLLFCTIIFFFSQVGCTQPEETRRELYKNLTVLKL